MKKVFFLIAFLFSVVCYAGPSPGILPPATDEVVYVTELNQVQVEISVQELNVQEVAYVYLGSPQFPTGYTELFVEPLEIIRFAEIPVIWMARQLIALNKPPSFVLSVDGVELLNALKDKQNTNYGYPLTANKVSRAV